MVFKAVQRVKPCSLKQVILQGILELGWPFKVVQNQNKGPGREWNLGWADPFHKGQFAVRNSVVALSSQHSPQLGDRAPLSWRCACVASHSILTGLQFLGCSYRENRISSSGCCEELGWKEWHPSVNRKGLSAVRCGYSLLSVICSHPAFLTFPGLRPSHCLFLLRFTDIEKKIRRKEMG